jgi:TolB-like protein
MHKDPSQRFASGLELLKGLEQASQRGALAHTQQVRHQPKWMKVVGGILISFVLVGVALRVPSGKNSDVTAIRLQNIQSVAVVAFHAPAGDEQAQILARALPEDITMALGKSGLRVAASSKAVAGGENEDPQTIGARLGVDSVLQGTVRSYGSRIRVRLELVSTTTGFQLWNETLTIEPGDLLTNEEKIASDVGQKLRTAVGGGR